MEFPTFEDILGQMEAYIDFQIYVEKAFQPTLDYASSQIAAFLYIEESYRNCIAKWESEDGQDMLDTFEDEFPVWMVRFQTTLGIKLPACNRVCIVPTQH